MHDPGLEDHDLGLHHDLKVMTAQMERRRLLGFLATGGAGTLLAACGGGGGGSTASGSTTTATTTTATTTTPTTTTGATTTTTTSSGACIADPTETNGPYPSDGTNSVNGTISNILTASGVVRTDIRSSFNGLSGTATGAPMSLTITVVNTNAACAVLAGYAVYIWHCTADGKYSLYDLPQQNYLRGVGVTDANGQVTFTSIFPGCYAGRYPHIHFEVFPSLATATSQRTAVLTSQLAMPRDICSAVYAAGGYGNSTANLAQVTTSSDGVFGDNTAAQIAAQTPTLAGSVAAGFNATVTVGIAL